MTERGISSPAQQIERLLDELYEVRSSLREIAQRLARIESRAKRAFPSVSAPKAVAAKRDKETKGVPPTMTREEALVYFDHVRDIAAGENVRAAIEKLDALSLPNLGFLAKELGLSLGKSKPSRRHMTDAVLSRVKQSLMLRQHTNVRTPDGGD